MLRNEKYPGFEHPYNLLEYFQTKDIDSNNTLQKRQKQQPKNNRFSEEETKKYIPRTEN